MKQKFILYEATKSEFPGHVAILHAPQRYVFFIKTPWSASHAWWCIWHDPHITANNADKLLYRPVPGRVHL